jgi:hypothetical protein
MESKVLGKIGNTKIVVVQGTVKNTKIKTFKIMAQKTFENRTKKTSEADMVDYEDLQKLVKEKWNKFADNNKRHQINVLADVGWRAGKRFDGKNYDFYDPSIYYNDGVDNIEDVVAIEILEF